MRKSAKKFSFKREKLLMLKNNVKLTEWLRLKQKINIINLLVDKLKKLLQRKSQQNQQVAKFQNGNYNRCSSDKPWVQETTQEVEEAPISTLAKKCHNLSIIE